MSAKVTIFQRIVPHYRIELFNQLYLRLKEKGIQLSVVYGQHRPGTVPEGLKPDQPWATYRENKYIDLFGQELVIQSGFRESVRDSDLIIVEQANRLVTNYMLFAARRLYKYSLAYWGHGKNYQGTSSWFSGSFKSHQISKVDWWFTYTSSCTEEVAANRFPEEKISTLQNSLDTKTLIDQFARIRKSDGHKIKIELGITSENIGLFCGGLDEKKELGFVLAACDEIKKIVSDFHIIFIGHGPGTPRLKVFAETRPWVHHIGQLVGTERVPYFHLSKCLVMPGALGLVVIDSFALETPVVTTDNKNHSPEFDYLENDVNALITSFELEDFSAGVVEILKDENHRRRLVSGCIQARERYTLSNMLDHFVDGIEKCLAIHQEKHEKA